MGILTFNPRDEWRNLRNDNQMSRQSYFKFKILFWRGKNLGHSDLEGFTRTGVLYANREFISELPFVSREKRPEIQKKERFIRTPPSRYGPNSLLSNDCYRVSLGRFSSVARTPLSKNANFIVIVVSPSLRVEPLWGVKQGRFVIFRFPLFCSVWGSQDTQMLGKTARKTSLSYPALCAPNASKN